MVNMSIPSIVELTGVFENPGGAVRYLVIHDALQFPEICSREASYDDHSSRGQSQYNHEMGQFSEGPSDLGHREQ